MNKENKNIQNEGKTKKKLLSPTLDIVFQALFGEVGSEKITKKFLEAILERKIEEVDLSQNIVLRRENIEDKMGVLDVLAKINNNEYCNIEMQLVGKEKLLERMLYYWAKVYTKNMKSRNNYNKLKKTIEVLIANFEIEELKELEYHSKWKIIEEKGRKLILTDDLEFHIIEIPKLLKQGEIKNQNELAKWIYFIENPESERVGEYMKENKEMNEAKEKLRVISKDEEMQRIAELREKAIRDEKAVENYGIKKGKREGTIEIAKRMKQMGLDTKTIKEATNLTEEEIKSL